MTEALVAESFAALAAGCGVAGVALALPRNRAPRRARRADARYLWMAVSAVIGAVVPGPKLMTVPLALLLGIGNPPARGARADARRRRAMDAELPQLLDLLAAESRRGSVGGGGTPTGRCRPCAVPSAKSSNGPSMPWTWARDGATSSRQSRNACRSRTCGGRSPS